MKTRLSLQVLNNNIPCKESLLDVSVVGISLVKRGPAFDCLNSCDCERLKCGIYSVGSLFYGSTVILPMDMLLCMLRVEESSCEFSVSAHEISLP